MLQVVFADHVVNNYRDFARSTDSAAYHAFWRGMVDRGQMFTPQSNGCWFVSGAHSEHDIEKTLEVAQDVFMTMAAQARNRESGVQAR